ncbi:response regulator [Sphingomonas sp. HF-S4]|uniref:Response regulator n=1 Tax=Sphingomonas agrestis TaxID=3080540 RepID=A0ABU3Y495_9SPHN|nr:response regulator [Sphingomonas sp. HF-S4]MDV3456163.1 response regulator [Sphingomonas sp. HF-S4]
MQQYNALFSPNAPQATGARTHPKRLPDGSSHALRKVYIVDDERASRQSLHLLVTALGYRARPFLSGIDFLEEIDSLRPGCVLLDLWMPGLDGIEVLRRMGGRFDVLPVVMLTAHAEVATAVSALKLGASDFLEKPPNQRLLQEAIARAFETIDREQAANQAFTHNARLISSLSTREREVLQGLGAGMSNKVIAAELGLSVRTIEMHRARMMDRLGVKTVADVVALAIGMGIAGKPRS